MGEISHTAPTVALPEIDKLFPFYFIVNKNMSIVSMGASLQKIIAKNSEYQFNTLLKIIKPKSNNVAEFDYLKVICSGFVLVGIQGHENTLLKGQFELRAEEHQIVFFGSLWADEHEKLLELGLTYTDFPAYDAIFDIQQMKSVLKNEQEDIEKLRQELTIINHSSDLFLNLHSSGLIRKASPTCFSMLGYEPFEMIGV